jgi:two-component system, sensor histidine kinase and response regulator
MRAVFQAFPDLFFWLDSNGRILDCKGGRAIDMYLPPEKMIGKNVSDIPFADVAQQIQKTMASVIQTKSMTSIEYSLVIRNQEHFYEARLIPLIKGKMIMIVRNITDAKKNEEILRKARDKAEEATRIKSEFLANMSHEIRTPMNAILGFCDIMLDEEATEQQRDYLNIIHNAGENLLNIINDILDLSKIESGKFTVEIAQCSLWKLLHTVESLMFNKAADKGIEFKVVQSEGLPETVQTDSLRLQQCLINLIGNAIKFTEKGHIHLKVSLEETGGLARLRFDVRTQASVLSRINKKLFSIRSFRPTTALRAGTAGRDWDWL